MTDLTVVPPIETTAPPPYDQDAPETYEVDSGRLTYMLTHPLLFAARPHGTIICLVEDLCKGPLSEATRTWYCERILAAIEASR